MREMTSRERVMTTLEHQEPDRVPLDLSMTIGAYSKLVRYLGLQSSVDPEPQTTRWETYVPIDLKVLEALSIDVVHLSAQPPRGIPRVFPDETVMDEWGIRRKRVERYGGGYYFEMIDHPLKKADIKDIAGYPWPSPYDAGVMDGLEEKTRALYEGTDLAIQVWLEKGGLGEQAGYLRGIEQWWTDLVINPDFAMALMNKLCDVAIEFDKVGIELIGKYVNVVRFTGWDLGCQSGPIFSPRMVEKMFKPVIKRLWTTVKNFLHRVNPKAKIYFHTCGGIYPLIPMFIECGLDILDPLQTTATGMDMDKIKREFGDQLVFHGSIDIQHVMPFGTADEVREEVKLRIKQLAPGGGFILAPSHAFQDDTPPENIVAMYEAGKLYGRYPISH